VILMQHLVAIVCGRTVQPMTAQCKQHVFDWLLMYYACDR
jgi:hypothetical protein